MFATGTSDRWNDKISEGDRNKVRAFVALLGDEIKAGAVTRGLSLRECDGVPASDVVAILDPDLLHLSFQRTFSAMSSFLALGVERKSDAHEAAKVGHQELGFTAPGAISVPRAVLGVDENIQKDSAKRIAGQYLDNLAKALSRPRAIAGYEALQSMLDAFSTDHPEYDRNVFVAMRFAQTKQNDEIWNSISATLRNFGMFAHRADAKSYPQDDDLWNNVCVYMLGCKYGICVFDQIDDRDFNPNVQIEYGFMRACNKRVLLLKDQRQPTMPVDITGKIRREFDTYDIASTVAKQVSDWVERDLGLRAT
ncbi:hypothetical protein [Vitreimonas flagellata]|uniref:hypothetical protein n=1 Tax=Vitreimonas flagellata TaxID=2560861 RepID=UPI00142F90F5|nr:hypothetical protein [Vitreimonas flagellata]